MADPSEVSIRDVNIAFANKLSFIWDTLANHLWKLIRLANRHLLVSILQSGPAVGDPCIAVDPLLIVDSVLDEAHVIRPARDINWAKSNWVIDKIKTASQWFEHPVAALLGFASRVFH
jgi:UDP-N-acetyl-D-mannosaminuronic acid dehydrogenase